MVQRIRNMTLAQQGYSVPRPSAVSPPHELENISADEYSALHTMALDMDRVHELQTKQQSRVDHPSNQNGDPSSDVVVSVDGPVIGPNIGDLKADGITLRKYQQPRPRRTPAQIATDKANGTDKKSHRRAPAKAKDNLATRVKDDFAARAADMEKVLIVLEQKIAAAEQLLSIATVDETSVFAEEIVTKDGHEEMLIKYHPVDENGNRRVSSKKSVIVTPVTTTTRYYGPGHYIAKNINQGESNDA